MAAYRYHSRPLVRGRGLKLCGLQRQWQTPKGRPLVRGRGLKLISFRCPYESSPSPACTGAWIETDFKATGFAVAGGRPLVRGRGLKQGNMANKPRKMPSPACTGAWIETSSFVTITESCTGRPLVRGRGLKQIISAFGAAAESVARLYGGVD